MNTLNRAKRFIEKSQEIIVLPSLQVQENDFGAGLGLFYTLKKIGKNANLLSEKTPEKFQFLNQEGAKIRNGLERADLLITLGAQSLENLNDTFKNSKGHKIPILNIDNQITSLPTSASSAGKNFKGVNLIDTRSCSLSETLTNFIKFWDEKLFDQKIATTFLAGLIASSQNFQDPKTKPETLKTASFLIEKGADHQKIIQCLYRTKSIAQIRLLGKILEKLNLEKKNQIYWTSLAKKDFQNCQAKLSDLKFAIEELNSSFHRFPSFLMLWESHYSSPIIKGVFYSHQKKLIEKILKNFGGISKEKKVSFQVRNGNLNSTIEKIFKII